jgi:hypothetical protein
LAADYDKTDEFRGAHFTEVDFTGARFRACDLRHAKIVDCWLTDISLSGDVENFVVNDVDVTSYVESELDRRNPERVQVRQMQTADEYRAMWDTLNGLWEATVTRARQLPEDALHERVDDEWSFVETLRHLVLATDAWASRTILDEPMPYHPLGLMYSDYPTADAIALGLDMGAKPSLGEVVEVRAGRMSLVRRIVDGLTDSELERMCARMPAPGYSEEPRSVGTCLRVIMREECEHRRYAERDLSVLESR